VLRQLTNDDCARGIRELGELLEMKAGDAARAGPLERRANEQRELGWRRDDDRFATYVRILVVINGKRFIERRRSS